MVANLLSGGGAYLVGNFDQLNAWPGSANLAAYDSIPFGADQGLVASVCGIPVVVLGSPDPLYVLRYESSVVFATAVSCEDEAEIETFVAAANDHNWTSIGEFSVTGSVAVIDSADSGADADTHGAIVPLEPGKYSVESRLLTPNPDTELQLVRLRRS